MNHREVIRVAEGSRFAVLMIHGIAGTPAHFRDLISVVPADWSLYNILLDGHGGSVEDFARTSMRKWKAQAADTLRTLLERHEQVIIVAHSMGTLFSIQAAMEHPDRIPALFLLNVPTRPRVKARVLPAAVRAALGRVSPGDRMAREMIGDCSIRLDGRLWKYIAWLPRFVELLGECARVRRALPGLKTPGIAFLSARDELVSARSEKDLAGCPVLRTEWLRDSGHFACAPEDTEILRSRLREMIDACKCR